MSNKKHTEASAQSFQHHELSPLAKAVRLSVLGVGLSLVTTTSHSASVVVTSNTDNGAMCTLREAIGTINNAMAGFGCTNSGAEPFGTNDTILFSSTGSILLGISGELQITNDVVINASTVNGVTIDADQNSRIFYIAESLTVTLDDLTITGGYSEDNGGGIYGGEQTDITILDSTVTSNNGGRYGGGLFIGAYSKLQVSDSNFSFNESDRDGGAIYAEYSEQYSEQYTEVLQGSTVTLTNTTISGNTAAGDQGGGIWSYGYGHVVELTNSTVSGNTSDTQGGGIFAAGYNAQLRIIDSSISNNTTGFVGGGIYLNGENHEVQITGGSISNNTSGREGGGIAVLDQEMVEVNLQNVTVNDNYASESGGGIYLSGSGQLLSIKGGSIDNNISGGYGGGISVFGEATGDIKLEAGKALGDNVLVTIDRSSVSNNTAILGGGGIFISEGGEGGPIDTLVKAAKTERANGNVSNAEFANVADDEIGLKMTIVDSNTLQLRDSKVDGNTVAVSGDNYGGGILAYNATVQMSGGSVSNNQNGYYGGGIAAFDSTVSLLDATISGNSSIGDGGGIYTYASTVTLTNSTVSANHAGTDQAHEGGGIWSIGGYLTLNNSTVSGNSVFHRGGGIYSSARMTVLNNSTVSDNSTGYEDGGVSINGDSFSLINSIVANSIGGDDCSGYASPTIDTASIIEDGSCAATRSGDPGLLPLANNGGNTPTHALASMSMARDTGDNATCLANDQRGENRDDGACDVGAFEFVPGTFYVIPLANGKVVVVPL